MRTIKLQLHTVLYSDFTSTHVMKIKDNLFFKYKYNKVQKTKRNFTWIIAHTTGLFTYNWFVHIQLHIHRLSWKNNSDILFVLPF